MILGAVLAGGRSARFGADKALALWKGVALIDHVVGRLATIAPTVIVCGRRHGDATAIADRPSPDLGPLAGLNAALHHAAANGFDRVVCAPCDTPLLDDGLLASLAAAKGDAVLRAMPVIGCWTIAGAALLDEHLGAGGDRSIGRWAERVGAAPLRHAPPPNINRPADLEMLDER